MTIDEMRLTLDKLDDELSGLLARRLSLSRSIQKKKKDLGLPRIDLRREDEIIERLREQGVSPEITAMIRLVVEQCRIESGEKR